MSTKRCCLQSVMIALILTISRCARRTWDRIVEMEMIDDVFDVHGDAYLDDIQDLGSSSGNRTPSVESLSGVVDDVSLRSRSSSDSLDGDDIGRPSMDIHWTVPGSPRIDFDFTVGLPDDFQNLGVHDRPPDFDVRFRNIDRTCRLFEAATALSVIPS